MKIANRKPVFGLPTPIPPIWTLGLPIPALRVPSTIVLAWVLALGCGGADSGAGSGADGGQAPGDEEGVSASESASPGAADLAVDPALLPEGVTEAMVEEGRSLFAGGGICYTCHLVDGTGGPLAPDLTDQEWINVDGEYASIIELVKTGVAQPKEHPGAMLPRAGMPLTDEQVSAVAAYTYLLSRM